MRGLFWALTFFFCGSCKKIANNSTQRKFFSYHRFPFEVCFPSSAYVVEKAIRKRENEITAQTKYLSGKPVALIWRNCFFAHPPFSFTCTYDSKREERTFRARSATYFFQKCKKCIQKCNFLGMPKSNVEKRAKNIEAYFLTSFDFFKLSSCGLKLPRWNNDLFFFFKKNSDWIKGRFFFLRFYPKFWEAPAAASRWSSPPRRSLRWPSWGSQSSPLRSSQEL